MICMIMTSFVFASNLKENGRFVSTAPWLYTAEHRKKLWGKGDYTVS